MTGEREVRELGPTVNCPEMGSRVEQQRCTGSHTASGERCAHFVQIKGFSVVCKLKCLICDAALEHHRRCQSCNMFIGTNHVSLDVYAYREHKICAMCVKRWHKLDELAGRKTTWSEFMQPDVSMVK